MKCKNKIICADAYLSNRTIDFFNENYKHEKKTIIINNVPTNERKAFLLHEQQYYYYMKKALENNEKIYCVFGSEKKMRKTIKKLEDDGILKEDERLYYCSSCDDKNKKLLLDVNEHWKKYKAVFTTATITIGVSFKEFHFNKTFIIGYPSCTARDLFQSHQRVRNLIDNEIYFTLPKKTSYNYIYGLCSYYLSFYFNFDDEIKNNYDIQYKLLQKIKDKINNCNGYCELYKGQNLKKVEEYEIFLKNLKELPEDLKKIKQYNLLEYIINGLYYNYSFYYFLNKCNYKINKDFFIDFEQLDKDIKEKTQGNINYFEHETRYDMKDEEEYRRTDKELLNDYNYKEVYEKIKNSIATEEEKYKMNRYYFNKLLTNQEIINIDLFDYLYKEFWDNRFNQHIIKNIKSEVLNKFEFIKINDNEYREKETNETFTKDEINFKGYQLYYINELKDILKIDNYNNQPITRENINNCIQYLEKERKEIYSVFRIREQKKDKTKEINFKECLTIINAVFEHFNGCKIIGDEKDYNKSKKIYNSYVIKNNSKVSAIEKTFNLNFKDLFINKNIVIEEFKPFKKTDHKQYLFIE